MICPNCGFKNKANADFCANCGYNLKNLTELTDNEPKVKTEPTCFCPNCGHQNSVKNVFCEECGTRRPEQVATPNPLPVKKEVSQPEPKQEPEPTIPVESEPEPVAPVVPVAPLEPKAAEPVAESTPKVTRSSIQQQEPKKSKKGLWIGLIVVLLLAAGGGGGWYYLNAQTANQKEAAALKSSKAKAKKDTAKEKKSSSKSKSETKKEEESLLPFDVAEFTDDGQEVIDTITAKTAFYVAPTKEKKFAEVNGTVKQRSASSIKLFVLAVAYSEAKKGSFNLNGEHTLTAAEKVAGTGTIQTMPNGSKIKNSEILEHMIVDSDNTAANIIIEELGGLTAVNDKIHALGFVDTTLGRKMMDTAAQKAGKDNYTTAKDMGVALTKIYNKKMVSKTSDQAMLDILQKNHNHTKLPADLPAVVNIYNKTGEYSDFGVENDAVIIESEDKGALVVVVLSQDGQSGEQKEMMNEFGLTMYDDYFEQVV